MYICIYVLMYVCMYIRIYIHTYIHMSSYCCICVLILLFTTYMSSYSLLQTYIHMSSYCYICVLILLFTTYIWHPTLYYIHTTYIHMPSCCYMCPHPTLYCLRWIISAFFAGAMRGSSRRCWCVLLFTTCADSYYCLLLYSLLPALIQVERCAGVRAGAGVHYSLLPALIQLDYCCHFFAGAMRGSSRRWYPLLPALTRTTATLLFPTCADTAGLFLLFSREFAQVLPFTTCADMHYCHTTLYYLR